MPTDRQSRHEIIVECEDKQFPVIVDELRKTADVVTVPDYATSADIQRAREMYASGSECDIEVDDDAKVSESDDGTWVQAWVWLPNVEEDEEDGEPVGGNRLIARFRPQKWMGDEAVEVAGAVDFDATEAYLSLPLPRAINFRLHDYDSDQLAQTLHGRQEHEGPFEVDVELDEWLERNGVTDGRAGLTQDHLYRLRAEFGIQPARV
jgi:hypothetical protein